MKQLNLSILEDGISTGLSVRNGGFLAEAASICLQSHNHGLSILFKVEGYLAEIYNLSRCEVNQLALNSFADLEEAAQFGAMGIAVAIINNQTGWKVIRSWKGTGFDYWFGFEDEGYPFQNKLRVEVSGDLKGTDPEINARLKQKLEQTKKSDELNISACAVIVEFSNPKSLTAIR
ncbi:MAG: hypothetical protein JWR61_4011 [Ferruginibacter sp.]|uniref:hypothetical protein n=1 Tax=Ferruginibacter sp. TaxID=1940288 RepID=UPI0026594001|nr:hypothetical protein [Ferruginibacter sp.]MDB5279056.1 hypothetical protein [Ferruginibacter sp.]